MVTGLLHCASHIDALPFGRLWYGEPTAISNAIDYAKFCNRSHDAIIRVYDAANNVIETHEHKGDFKSLESEPTIVFTHFSHGSKKTPLQAITCATDALPLD